MDELLRFRSVPFNNHWKLTFVRPVFRRMISLAQAAVSLPRLTWSVLSETFTEAEELQNEVNRLREIVLGDPAKIQQARELEAATGMRRVVGDGMVVRLADGPEAATRTGHRVIDFDLQIIVNTLWYLGAEAISINGHRLTSLSPMCRTQPAATHSAIAPTVSSIGTSGSSRAVR